MSSADNDSRLSSTTLDIFGGPASDQIEAPPWTPDIETAYIVGPMIYMYFSAANTSDAGFAVDLLFQHPDYFKASFCFILS